MNFYSLRDIKHFEGEGSKREKIAALYLLIQVLRDFKRFKYKRPADSKWNEFFSFLFLKRTRLQNGFYNNLQQLLRAVLIK